MVPELIIPDQANIAKVNFFLAAKPAFSNNKTTQKPSLGWGTQIRPRLQHRDRSVNIGIAKAVLGMNSWPARSRRVQHSVQAITLSPNS